MSKKQPKTKHQNTKLSVVKKGKSEEIIKEFFEADIFLPERQLLKEYKDLFNLEKLTPSQNKRKGELELEIAMLYGLENGMWATTISRKKYYGALATMRKNIVNQYNCRASLELMLADRIVASYWRALKCDMVFNRLIEDEDGNFSFNQLKVNVLKEFNKGMELANRQLSANIILLKELKQPKLDVKVRTDNAYIAQNQQLNINPNKDSSNKDENIEPK